MKTENQDENESVNAMTLQFIKLLANHNYGQLKRILVEKKSDIFSISLQCHQWNK